MSAHSVHAYMHVCVCVFCSGKLVTLVWHTVTLQDLKESHRVYCWVARQHRTMLEKNPVRTNAAPPPHTSTSLKGHATNRVTGLFVLLPLQKVCRPHVVDSSTCSARGRRRDWDTERERCVSAKWSRLHNICFKMQLKTTNTGPPMKNELTVAG